ncbi:unnamed protein product [Moneuplotes crassus]|uniref:Uncharacterized protein n=1 Tax=Euplotes crassus TaxID=5936 RepID=A0AAD1UBM4_EUPCR|nr:unnamed protein product [Moneuplotes crassus]
MNSTFSFTFVKSGERKCFPNLLNCNYKNSQDLNLSQENVDIIQSRDLTWKKPHKEDTGLELKADVKKHDLHCLHPDNNTNKNTDRLGYHKDSNLTACFSDIFLHKRMSTEENKEADKDTENLRIHTL